MVGMGVLITASVFTAVALQNRFHLVGQQAQIANAIKEDEDTVNDLRRYLNESNRIWAEVEKKNVGFSERFDKLFAARKQADEQVTSLTTRKSELDQQIPELAQELTRYQFDYRKKIWGSAIGDKMAVLKTRDGREYSQVEIINVTQAGLEIRHEFGMARFKPDDLAADMQERFQWAAASALLNSN